MVVVMVFSHNMFVCNVFFDGVQCQKLPVAENLFDFVLINLFCPRTGLSIVAITAYRL